MVKALIPKGQLNRRRSDVPMLFGVELRDAQEEMFVIMVCDGLPMGLAFKRAGFTSKHSNAPSNLFNLPRVQERANKILEARRTTGVVSLPEVTNMLQRVFASAHAAEEFSAAHNAAFSLARLYGHVTDKSVVEHIRRPSRDPDAPSETALEAWAASLPVVSPPASPAPSQAFLDPIQRPPTPPQIAPIQGSPASLLGPEPLPCTTPLVQPDVVMDWASASARSEQGPGGTGNGAPVDPVTGAPHPRGGSELLVSRETGTGTRMGEKTAPLRREPDRQVNEPDVVIPSFEQLFGDGGESR